MTKTLLRAGRLACALLTCTALTAPAMAQNAQEHRALDGNGVDLTHGDFVMSVVEGSIGSGLGELQLVRTGVWYGGGYITSSHQWDAIGFHKTNVSGGVRYTVSVGPRYETFSGTGTLPTGSSLSGSFNNFVYRNAAGMTIEFSDQGQGGWGTDSNLCTGDPGQGACTLVPVTISEPNGTTVSLSHDFWADCWGEETSEVLPCHFTPRLNHVSNSFGYNIQFAYSSDGSGGGSPPSSWFQRTAATFHNDAVSGNPSQGSVSYSYPSNGVNDVTDMGGRSWRFTGTTSGVFTGIRRPGATSDTTTISYTGPIVTSVVNEGVTTTYSRSVSGSTATMTVTAVDGDTGTTDPVTTAVSNLTTGRLTSLTDPLSRVTGFQYDSSNRLTRVTRPEGNYTEFTYDSRGNVTETRQVAKSGSGLADIVTTASYDSSCSNPVTCNQPNSITDARGNVTDYTYDSTHGGVLTATAPAVGGFRPQTRYSYTLTNGEYQLTGVSACATGSTASPTCVGTADETRTTIAHDSNGNITSQTVADGTGTLSAATAMTYDALGNLLTVDGPLSGTGDTIRFRYNAARQPIGAVGPDPDGAGSLKHRAQRTTYTNGLPTKVETGTVDSQSDSDWASFASLEGTETVYDANARPIVSRLVSGSTVHALTQTDYDALGRARCVAQRMNPSEFASLPSDACTLDTQGSYGPDRIARTSYDLAGQVTKVETGVGVTGVAADEVTTTYRNNGQAETITDGNGNKTTYVYDGHDRLSRTRMPDPSTAGTSSTTDYEELTYLTATVGGVSRSTPLVASRRLRDGTSIGFAYDALNRLTNFNRPNSERNQSFEYDNLGRMTDADQTNASIDYSWDALGRLTSHADGGFGTTAFEYDLAGRRTRMTWPDNFYVTYQYSVAGDMTAILESGSASLAAFTYDDRGRRTLLTRGNGTTTSYAYDNVSRLTQLVQNLDGSGTTNDLTLDFTRNPASQIVSNDRSNNGYSFTGHANIHLAPSIDGLNRIVNTGFGYDNNGNLTSDPGGWAPGHAAGSYTYDSTNRLTSGGGQSFYYDPAGQLLAQANSGGYTYFLNSGGQLIGEYNGSSVLQRRYVHGPGVDEPLVWYEGSGTSTRRYFHADERGSVIAVSDNSGNLYSTTNRYDETGVPQVTLTGRFGYTGQAWLPEVGLNYYRARMYNPSLSRFMQTDPIGYGDGMNLYAYVRNDPVNLTDPTGMCDEGQHFEREPGSLTGECVDDITSGGGTNLIGGASQGGGITSTGSVTSSGDNQQNIVITAGRQGTLIVRGAQLPDLEYRHQYWDLTLSCCGVSIFGGLSFGPEIWSWTPIRIRRARSQTVEEANREIMQYYLQRDQRIPNTDGYRCIACD